MQQTDDEVLVGHIAAMGPNSAISTTRSQTKSVRCIGGGESIAFCLERNPAEST